MAYDGDKAGRAAALKASKLLSAGGFSGGVVVFAEGVDPADMVKEGKVEELEKIFRTPQPFIEFVLDEILSLYDLHNPKEKERCLAEGVAYLKTLSPLLQEEYKTYLASRLGGMGISPSLVRINTQSFQQNQDTLLQKNSYKDMWELSIIKTMIEKPHMAQQILDLLKPELFSFHAREFALAIASQTSAPELIAIILDESIKTLESEEALHAELRTFLMKYYTRELKKINLSNQMSFEKKAFLIRKYRDTITRLKRGELVSIED
jgi:DNA primase